MDWNRKFELIIEIMERGTNTEPTELEYLVDLIQ